MQGSGEWKQQHGRQGQVRCNMRRMAERPGDGHLSRAEARGQQVESSAKPGHAHRSEKQSRAGLRAEERRARRERTRAGRSAGLRSLRLFKCFMPGANACHGAAGIRRLAAAGSTARHGHGGRSYRRHFCDKPTFLDFGKEARGALRCRDPKSVRATVTAGKNPLLPEETK